MVCASQSTTIVEIHTEVIKFVPAQSADYEFQMKIAFLICITTDVNIGICKVRKDFGPRCDPKATLQYFYVLHQCHRLLCKFSDLHFIGLQGSLA